VQAAPEPPAEIRAGDSAAQVETEPAAAMPKTHTKAPTAPAVQPVAAAEPEVAVEPVAEPAPDPRPKRRRSAKATGRRAAKTAAPAVAATAAQEAPGRPGERPSGEQFLADLAAVGSFKALAAKYGKSIGTIGNWANQLREQGFNIPVGRQKKS
jgi:hypothetical protein